MGKSVQHLEIERNGEIRCGYCLDWNSKEEEICKECTAPLIPIENFGAARAIKNWEGCASRNLESHLNREKQERITHWNDLFHKQFSYILSITSELNSLESGMIMDVQDDIDKLIIHKLPLKPDEFKTYQNYMAPDEKLSEIGRLKYIYRAHPVLAYRLLAGLALVYSGGGDERVFNELIRWRPDSQKVHQERLLCFAHWSVNFNCPDFSHQYNVDDILPLYDRGGEISKWARLYLFIAGYNTGELKYELEDFIHKGSFHLALSSALVLRKYDQIRDLVIDHIDEGTLPIALRYSDEDFVPPLLRYLKFAPLTQHEKIVRRLGSLQITEPDYRKKICNWLLKQENDSFLDIVFRWEEIPQFKKILERLLRSNEGLQDLESSLPTWIDNSNENQEVPEWIMEEVFSSRLKPKNPKGRKSLENLKLRVFEKYFDKQCAVTKNTGSAAAYKKLFKLIFDKTPLELTSQQINFGFHAMQKVAKERNASGKIHFNFSDKSIADFCGSVNVFLRKLKTFLMDGETNTAVSDWLEVIFYEMATSRVNYRENKDTLKRLINMMTTCIVQCKINKSLRTRYLNFVNTRKDKVEEPEKLSKKIEKILEVHDDHDTKYWVQQIV